MADDHGPRQGFVRTILTEDDANRVWDPIRIGLVVAMLVYFGLTGWTVIKQGRAFDMQGFGIGFGTLTAGVGAGMYARKKADA